MNDITLSAADVGAANRDSIITYASSLLPPGDRGPNEVIERARPLLNWAAEADSPDDLRNRMRAMNRAFQNDQARLCADRSPVPFRLSPHDFLTVSRAYYEVIAGKES